MTVQYTKLSQGIQELKSLLLQSVRPAFQLAVALSCAGLPELSMYGRMSCTVCRSFSIPMS